MRKIILLICISSSGFTQSNIVLTDNLLKNTLDSSLKYIINCQTQTTVDQKYYKGEWEVNMELTENYFFIGRKQKARDSNCFTTAAIHNFLAEIYLLDSTKKELLPVLTDAFTEIKSYRNGQRYNFWKNLPPNRQLKFRNEPNPQPLIRRPTNFDLKKRFICNASNIPEDADDTSLGNLSEYYQNKIFGKKEEIISYKSFDSYVDTDRQNRNWYNVLIYPKHGNSGAFLTWHGEEYKYNNVSLLRIGLNTLFIFVPGTKARPHAYQPWIPYRANDIDIVVNANVLSYLAVSNQIQLSTNKSESINLINKKIKDKYWQNSGNYYPNLYHAHYAVSRAYQLGVSDLENSMTTIVEDLSNKQKANGSYRSKSFLNNYDEIQSTAYALHAMLDLKLKGIDVQKASIDNAMIFLINKGVSTPKGKNWAGGVFFSGGSVLRNILVWKSDAYTTALIAACIQKYLIIYVKK